jgi:hypothetical protein
MSDQLRAVVLGLKPGESIHFVSDNDGVTIADGGEVIGVSEAGT